MTTERRARAARAAFAAVLVYFLATAVAAAIVQGELWDLRLFHHDALDATWRLELAWRAWRGEWSGVHFQYPRGPLWQLYGLVAMHLGRDVFGDAVGWPLALLDAGFHVTTLLTVAWLVATRVPRPGPRLVALLAFALLSRVTGAATLRGFLPLVVVLVYAPPDLGRDDEGPLAGPPLRAAAATLIATLFGFDRLYSAGLCVGALATFELAVRHRRAQDPRRAVKRALVYGAGCAGGLLLIALAQTALGGDPLGALGEHAQLSAAYAAHMSMPWGAGVPRAVVASLFVAVLWLALLLGARRGRGEGFAGALWLIGAAPAATFALMRADEGHLILSLLPAFGALILVAAGADPPTSRGVRQIAGGVAALALFGWFATHPEQTGGDPRVFVEVVDVLRGERGPATGHRTDYGNALRWARARYAEQPPDACLGVTADMTFLHPALDRRGPTELSLRWSDAMKTALADRIERARCPYFVYWGHTREEPRLSWSFGEDFVRVAQLYEPDSPAGVAIHGLRLREQPLVVDREELSPAQPPTRMAMNTEHRVALERPARHGDLLTLELTLEIERWRTLAGGAPYFEYRFERDGLPMGEWDHFYGLAYGRPSRVHISPDPRLTELLFIEGRAPEPGDAADTLVLRLAPGGMASPADISVTVGAIEGLRVARARPSTPRCESEVDLAQRLAHGRGFANHGRPAPSLDFFDLDPYEPGHHVPEVVFAVTPCPGTCVQTYVLSHLPEGQGDGAVAEIYVRDGAHHTHIAGGVAPPGEVPVSIEASLEDWAERPIEIEMLVWPGAVIGDDAVRFYSPVLRPCVARRGLAELLDDGTARVSEGRGAALGDDLELAAGGGEVRLIFRVIRDTCFETGAALTGATGASARASIRVADGDVQHLLDERTLSAGQPSERRRYWLSEFATRDVELVFEARPEPGSPAGRARLVDPRFVRCEEAP